MRELTLTTRYSLHGTTASYQERFADLQQNSWALRETCVLAARIVLCSHLLEVMDVRIQAHEEPNPAIFQLNLSGLRSPHIGKHPPRS